MQRLTGMDTSFIYLDAPSGPMHVGMCCVFDPRTVPGGYSFEVVRHRILERLELIAPFRRRVRFLPGHLHRPVWVDDSHFDVDEHLHRAVLRAPAGLPELERFTAEVMARPLDQRRPLWELHLVEGLRDGTVAAVTKMHHAAIDGVSAAELAVNLLDLDPDVPPASASAPKWSPAPPPSAIDLVVDATRDLLAQPFRAAATIPSVLGGALRLRHRHRRRDVAATPRVFGAPRGCCTGALTQRRVVAFTDLPLDAIKTVRHATATTINDVVLAVCAGALRDHLRDHDLLPDRPLVAAVPVAVADADHDPGTNRLSAILVELPTTIDDPLTRLIAMAANAAAAKEHHHQLGPHTLGRLADLAPPLLLAGIRAAHSQLNGRIPPLCNLMVSNFPGPPFPLYLAGAQMLAAYPLGPLTLGTGLNITVQSYLDRMWIGIHACPDLTPAPHQLPARLTDALHQLVSRLEPPGPPQNAEPRRTSQPATADT